MVAVCVCFKTCRFFTEMDLKRRGQSFPVPAKQVEERKYEEKEEDEEDEVEGEDEEDNADEAVGEEAVEGK